LPSCGWALPASVLPTEHVKTTRSKPLRTRVYETIFEADTRAGRTFDLVLMSAILVSVGIVMGDSVAGLHAAYGRWFMIAEWFFTILFTIEYGLRLWSAQRPLAYARSTLGIIDLLAVLPAYISLFVPGGQFLLVVRILRVVRVFRVLKLTQFVGEGAALADALRGSRHKIAMFLVVVLSAVVIIGSLMYLIEGPASGFTSIPTSIYWAIVTLTTVGYGDLAPVTTLGKMFASIVMIMGYGIIAVPTGIVSAELVKSHRAISNQVCRHCMTGDHAPDARFCRRCGHPLAD
jgi:voltage-gated potassium channel